MVPIKKHKIVLDLEHETLMELRKVLFRRGVSVQGFLSYISELVSIQDPRIGLILDEIPEVQDGRKTKSNKADADTLYALIEQEIKKKQNGA